MNTERYHQLPGELCQSAKLTNPDELIKNGLLRIDGMDLRIQFCELAAPDRLTVSFDFGICPPQKPDGMLPALLAVNFMLGGWITFGMSQPDRRVILVTSLPIKDEFTGQALLRSLIKMAKEARKAWRQALEMADRMESQSISADSARSRVLSVST